MPAAPPAHDEPAILVTSGGGTTATAAIRALARRGARVRAAVKSSADTRPIAAGAHALAPWSAASRSGPPAALFAGIDTVYYIAPPLRPDEATAGRRFISAARAAGVRRFVYHSVAHPQLRAMPHHWAKNAVEAALIDSGLAYTILQPTSYMQNILRDRTGLIDRGELAAPLPVTTPMCTVDVDDVGEAAAIVITTPGHAAATYELGGQETLTRLQMAAILTEVMDRPIRAIAVTMDDWLSRTTTAQNSAQRACFIAMYRHYAARGVPGNGNVLAMLLGRPATDFRRTVTRMRAAGQI